VIGAISAEARAPAEAADETPARAGRQALRSAEQVLALQRAAGNRAVTRILRAAAGPVAEVAYPGAPSKDGKSAPGTEVSTELSDSPDAATPAERVFKWLQAHAKEIGEQEAHFGVDRRAIAGAIAWEALENPRAAVSHGSGRFVGAGKAHVKQFKWVPAALYTGENVPEEVEQAGLLPPRSLAGREWALYTDSIPYIAGGMRLASDIARKYGKEISSDPAMLTWFWQTKDATTFIDYFSKKKPGTAFNPTAEKMPKWVVENLPWLEAAVGAPALKPLAPGEQPAKVGTMETGSWKGTFSIDARLPATREFLVTGGKVNLAITVDTDIVAAFGYSAYVVLHRRAAGSDSEVGEAKRVEIGKLSNVAWSDLPDGLYFFEVFSDNGVHVEGELDVDVPDRAAAPAAAGASPGAVQRVPVRRLARDPQTAVAAPGVADAGTSTVAAAGAAPRDEGALRANAARVLVQQLNEKAAKYGHDLDPDAKGGPQRAEGWWWNETEFDCSKFVLWVMAGRHVGDAVPGPEESKTKAIQAIRAEPFGPVAEASAVASMVDIVGRLAKAGKATPIDKTRVPKVGDLVFWTGHVGIVVELLPAPGGDTWIVYANMGVKKAGLIGVNDKGQHWLKLSEIAGNTKLASGDFLGYWTP
jgi:cell wall-associated NlpC family hydrolase